MPNHGKEIGLGRKRDFYNVLRDAFVISNNYDRTTEWVRETEEEAKRVIAEVLRKAYGIHTALSEPVGIDIVESSGNITFTYLAGGLSKKDREKLINGVKGLNAYAERLQGDVSPIIYNDTCFYLFRGRFHSLVVDTWMQGVQYLPVQFHAQLIW